MSRPEPTLFATDAEPETNLPGPKHVARVAMERGIDKLLDYVVPASLVEKIRPGQRVRVPLGRGNKLATGYVAELTDTATHPKLKAIQQIVDERTLLTPALMQLALWISRYYFTPFGMVLENMIPSAVKRRVGVKSIRVVRTLWTPAQIQELIEKTKARKRKRLLARVLQLPEGQTLELSRLAMECDVKPASVLPLVKGGVLSLSRVDSYAFQSHVDALPTLVEETHRPTPNADQQRAIDAIVESLDGGFKTHLIFGVTGSGKTEVYLRAIDAVVKRGRSAIVLVPEIALTPQTVRRFTQRFERVAVMHSGLTSTERHKQWQSITDGTAQVVVGARSGVFANVPNLGLIVVDEEHEASYKQDQAPRYHARDVAIKRAHLEKVPVVLGSATPSLEMWAKVRHEGGPQTSTLHSSNYRLLTLPVRVSDRPLPGVEIIDMKDANRGRRGVHLFSPRLEQHLKHTLEQKQQAILLLNRRGYSNFIYCSSCQEAVTCKYCDKTMTYHRGVDLKPTDRTTAGHVHAGQMICHYCLAVNTLPASCPSCGKKLSLFGLGTQRVEEELIAKFPKLRFERVDSDTMRGGRSYEDLLAKFGAGEIDVLMGTQMLAKGLDFPNVTLVGVINGDTSLSLPDFRAGERTFQLLTQVAGRAGRGSKPGRVLVQTFNPHDETIRLAVTQDYVNFATRELESRQAVDLPPFSRQARIIIRDEDPAVAAERAEALASDIRDAIATLNAPLTMKNDGPMPAAVGKIAGYVRLQILLSSQDAGVIQRVLGSLRHRKALISNDRVAIDIDPVSLL
jgi:primosomal protein N' (replication factor Y) (superfamily II helicase)